jgi:hypothetical protein
MTSRGNTPKGQYFPQSKLSILEMVSILIEFKI